MTQSFTDIRDSSRDQIMTHDQFSQVVEAILSGKYSWACVLILRFAGYNPLHYMPYRTYNRLMKEQLHSAKAKKNSTQINSNSKISQTQKSSRPLKDLEYLEEISPVSTHIKGGNRMIWIGLPSWGHDL